jgi:hypothetical protein
LLFALTAGCASTANDAAPNGTTSSDISQPADPAKPADPAEAFRRLTDLLKTPGALQIPARGKQAGANSLTADVHTAPSDIRKVVKAEEQALLTKMGSMDLVDLVGSDTNFETQGGFNEPTAKSNLVDSLIVPARRAEAKQLLDAIRGQYVRFVIDDFSSDPVGDEIIVLQPSIASSGNASDTLVVHVTYIMK